jgi:uncharacterized membrane protein
MAMSNCQVEYSTNTATISVLKRLYIWIRSNLLLNNIFINLNNVNIMKKIHLILNLKVKSYIAKVDQISRNHL